MLTVSRTQIANRALQMMGETFALTDLDTEDTNPARRMRAQYDDSLRATLEAGLWNFATARASLTAKAETPVYPSGAFYYGLPNDCIKVRDIDGVTPDYPWTVEIIGGTEATTERVILIEMAAPLKIKYTREVTTLTLWSPLARKAFAARLAADTAMAITNKASAVEMAETLYDRHLAEALLSDAQEGSNTQLYEGTWSAARW